jgi:hypothetical protein
MAKIPALDAFCVRPAAAATDRCITFPGGIRLCIPDPRLGHPLSQVESLLKLLQAALMPLQPFFDVLNVILAIKDCIEAVPGLLTDPSKLVKAITALLKAFGKLVALFPQVSVPKLVKDILGVVGFFLRAIASELGAFVSQAQRIAESATLAADLDIDALTAEVSCAQDAFDIEMANINASLGPLAQLLGVVNLLLKLIGAPEIAIDLSSSDDPAEAIELMLKIADAMEQASDAIPL